MHRGMQDAEAAEQWGCFLNSISSPPVGTRIGTQLGGRARHSMDHDGRRVAGFAN